MKGKFNPGDEVFVTPEGIKNENFRVGPIRVSFEKGKVYTVKENGLYADGVHVLVEGSTQFIHEDYFEKQLKKMKPKSILLVRHGESEGNVNKNIYAVKPDYALNLTELGIKQAEEAGRTIKDIIGDETVQFYVSPLFRTRQTFKEIIKSFDKDKYKHQEEPRIREQEWGHLRPKEESDFINSTRDAYGTFYYRIPDGESGADVYDRMASFFGSLHRDFEKPDFPENVVIVTHGMSIRLFLMKWFHWSVEEFEQMKNPYNCQVFTLLQKSTGKYALVNSIEKHEVKSMYHSIENKL